jgi:hypothetical protein
MKPLFLCLLLLLAGCESQRGGVRCIGAFEDPEAGVKYEPSTLNIIIGVFLVETLIVPAIVLLKETRCPVQGTTR